MSGEKTGFFVPSESLRNEFSLKPSLKQQFEVLVADSSKKYASN